MPSAAAAAARAASSSNPSASTSPAPAPSPRPSPAPSGPSAPSLPLAPPVSPSSEQFQLSPSDEPSAELPAASSVEPAVASPDPPDPFESPAVCGSTASPLPDCAPEASATSGPAAFARGTIADASPVDVGAALPLGSADANDGTPNDVTTSRIDRASDTALRIAGTPPPFSRRFAAWICSMPPEALSIGISLRKIVARRITIKPPEPSWSTRIGLIYRSLDSALSI